ncbi:SoxR reducing system RseC family protein [uncultured Prevotella sp.]|uniref:SoxR reducing system RseC family protein n=1 Tax=uncultured Prevotella sp. TaxID=159272 RepID=UPI0026759FA8|nr:SoxR reducing system RseC family protein [uncultured Prevotella sp.]
MKNEIRHLGVVDTVDVGLIKVRITQTSACSSCKMSGNCNASESKEKVVDVYCDNHYGLKTGDNVIVIASQRTGFLAVLLSSVIPLIILVAVLAIAFVVTQSEISAALFSLCSLIPYYVILYCMREKIRVKLSFHIDPLSVNTFGDNGLNL